MPSSRGRLEGEDTSDSEDEDSWERSSESGDEDEDREVETEEEEEEDYEDEEIEVSITDITNSTVDFDLIDGQPIFSPRSVEACRAVGVEPYDLIPVTQEFYDDLADQEMMAGSASIRRNLLKMQYQELQRRNFLRQALNERERIALKARSHAVRSQENYETPAEKHARITFERLTRNSKKALRSYANVRLKDHAARARCQSLLENGKRRLEEAAHRREKWFESHRVVRGNKNAAAKEKKEAKAKQFDLTRKKQEKELILLLQKHETERAEAEAKLRLELQERGEMEKQKRTRTKYRIAKAFFEQQQSALQKVAKTDALLANAQEYRYKANEAKCALTQPLLEKIQKCKSQREKMQAAALVKSKELEANKLVAEARRKKLLQNIQQESRKKTFNPQKMKKVQAKRDAIRKAEQDRAEDNHKKCLKAEENLAKFLKEKVARIEKRRADVLRSRSAPAGKNNGTIPSEGKELKRGIEATELGPGADEITVIVPKLNVKTLTVIVPGTGGPEEAPEAKLMIKIPKEAVPGSKLVLQVPTTILKAKARYKKKAEASASFKTECQKKQREKEAEKAKAEAQSTKKKQEKNARKKKKMDDSRSQAKGATSMEATSSIPATKAPSISAPVPVLKHGGAASIETLDSEPTSSISAAEAPSTSAPVPVLKQEGAEATEALGSESTSLVPATKVFSTSDSATVSKQDMAIPAAAAEK